MIRAMTKRQIRLTRNASLRLSRAIRYVHATNIVNRGTPDCAEWDAEVLLSRAWIETRKCLPEYQHKGPAISD